MGEKHQLGRGAIERNSGKKPFFSIISVSYKDLWALSKTARSIFRQQFQDFEYIIVDGNSQDGTQGLVDFWTEQGLVSKSLVESDSGVYDAMNRALQHASGQYACFMNAGDIFSSDYVLGRVRDYLAVHEVDGVLGWGELNGQQWSSWIESAAFKISSLGFCHQALYVKTELLKKYPFDSRPFKTDSDTLQLGSLYASGAQIPIVPETLAKRGGEPGISADLERTRHSILDTLTSQYSQLDEIDADRVLRFRRKAEGAEEIVNLLEQHVGTELGRDLALTVWDTLFLRQSKQLPPTTVSQIAFKAKRAIDACSSDIPADWSRRLQMVQEKRLAHLQRSGAAAETLKKKIHRFEIEEIARLNKVDRTKICRPSEGYVISLTSFPPRLPTLHFVIQSLVHQTCPPSRIHLWLGSDEVPGKRWLSKHLLAFEDFGLEIHFIKRTCLQYDKFLHNAELNREKKFVIVDDDVIYPPVSMQALLQYSEKYIGCVIANRTHEIGIAKSGRILPYDDWNKEVLFDRPSHAAFPTGAGGVLYPSGFYADSAVLEIEQIARIAPYADDIWLKLHSILQGRKSVSTHLSQKGCWYHRYTPTMTEGSLHATNVDFGLNDRQMLEGVAWLESQGINLTEVLQEEKAACL